MRSNSQWKVALRAIVNNSGNQTFPQTPIPESVSAFDRRGARAKRHAARPPARFSSLQSQETVTQKQEPRGNTLLAQRYPVTGNSYFWRTAVTQLSELPARSPGMIKCG
jgi:hypothetical protein